MTEKGDDEVNQAPQSSTSTWWGSFYDSAKQKLAETNEFLVRDIKEFTDTVRNDTSKLVADTAASMKDQLNIKVNLDEASNATKVVTNSISGFLGKVVQHVTPIPPDDKENDDSTMYMGTSSGVKVISPAEARLFSMQTSPATYCNEPDNVAEFEIWRESFSLEKKKEELSLLMLDSKEVRSLYTKLVPEAVSHVDFWTRYFYKKHDLQKAEERRARLVERAEASSTDLGWDDEDDFDVIDHPTSGKGEENSHSEPAISVIHSGNADQSTTLPIVMVEQSVTTSVTTEDKSSADVIPAIDDCVASSIKGAIESSPSSLIQIDVPKQSELISVINDVDASGCDLSTPKIVDSLFEVQGCKDSKVTQIKLGKNELFSSDSCMNESESKLLPNSTNNENIGKTALVKDSSSGDSSDWEKDFDLDMTEEEIHEALLEGDNTVDIEGWEEWE